MYYVSRNNFDLIIQRDTKMLKDTSKVMIERDPITDFDGIEDEEREGREALMKYVHSILVDDIDGALNATRHIRKYADRLSFLPLTFNTFYQIK